MATKKTGSREAKKLSAKVDIEMAEAGPEALIEMLEDLLNMAKENPDALGVGPNGNREIVFERLSASEFIGAAHRS